METGEIKRRVEQLALAVDETMRLMHADEREQTLHTLGEKQNALALAQDFKALATLSGEVKKLEQQLAPWKTLTASLADMKEMLTLINEGGSGAAELAEEMTRDLNVLEKTYREHELLALFQEEDDMRNAYLIIHAGAGGTEACDWAAMLQRSYMRFCERKNFKADLVDVLADTSAGIRSATILVKGMYASGLLQSESGVHRLVRISPFDAGKRRHTSFASVFVVPEVDDAVEVSLPLHEVRIDTFRASGAGGQHVNTTDSAVRLTHIPTGLVVSCQMGRSQHQNKETAFKVLRARLHERQREEQRLATKEKEKAQKKIEWGSQIRSYILHPYQMVKDHRTGYEAGDVKRVMDGDFDAFIEAFLHDRLKANAI